MVRKKLESFREPLGTTTFPPPSLLSLLAFPTAFSYLFVVGSRLFRRGATTVDKIVQLFVGCRRLYLRLTLRWLLLLLERRWHRFLGSYRHRGPIVLGLLKCHAVISASRAAFDNRFRIAVF